MDSITKIEEVLFIAALISYLVCSGIYIWYLISRNEKFVRVGTMLLYMGLLAQTVALGLRWYSSGHAPMSDLYESLSLFGWGIILFFLIAQHFYPVKAAGALVVPTAFLITSIAGVFYKGPEPLVPALQSYWLWIHVTIAMLSYGLFTLSFGAGFFYIVQEYLLKKNYRNVLYTFLILLSILGLALGFWAGSWWAEPAKVMDSVTQIVSNDYATSDYLKILGGGVIGLVVGCLLGFLAGKGASKPGFSSRLPSLDVLDEVSYRGIAFGFPLLTIGIITGAIWADQAWGRWWGWDPKETWSLITWLFYGAYLHTRLTMGWRGRHSAIIAVIGLIVVLFTYLGVNLFLSGLHSYAVPA
ncbi:MAG: c-type cytochrome biogenesis protein CcsB [Thermoleophilia bacterium]|nr:c-type cytochrome biogenesis protein CcsB [Thermoleophilia bacterium]